MWKELRRFAKHVAHDGAVRAILLAGDEGVFSSGADIREFATLRAPGATRAYDDLVESALRALEAVPQPTVACVAGPCVGAGARRSPVPVISESRRKMPISWSRRHASDSVTTPAASPAS